MMKNQAKITMKAKKNNEFQHLIILYNIVSTFIINIYLKKWEKNASLWLRVKVVMENIYTHNINTYFIIYT